MIRTWHYSSKDFKTNVCSNSNIIYRCPYDSFPKMYDCPTMSSFYKKIIYHEMKQVEVIQIHSSSGNIVKQGITKVTIVYNLELPILFQ